MKHLSVEDGMSDEQAALAKTFRECVVCGHIWYPKQEDEACPHCIRYPPRSATPEELTAQAENLNYKLGPRQAVPFMPQPEQEVYVQQGEPRYAHFRRPVESPEELPPLDDQAEARMKIMNDHPSFPGEAWEILAHCRERQLKQCMAENNRLRAVPVEERTRVLMEALKAVEKERLDTHDERLREAENFNLYRKETGEDAAYSLAIHHVESAIKKLIEPLLEDKSKPVVTAEEK